MDLNFFVAPQKDEIIETTIHINQNTKPALIGSVLDQDNKPIKDAFLALYEFDKKDNKPKKLQLFTYTDEWGSFLLAPLICICKKL